MNVFETLPSEAGILSRDGQAFKLKIGEAKPVIIQEVGGRYGVYANDQEFEHDAHPAIVCGSYGELVEKIIH